VEDRQRIQGVVHLSRRAGAGGGLQAEPPLAGTEEYITVFADCVEIAAGERRFTLHTGHSIRFPADTALACRNAGSEEALLSMLLYYAR